MKLLFVPLLFGIMFAWSKLNNFYISADLRKTLLESLGQDKKMNWLKILSPPDEMRSSSEESYPATPYSPISESLRQQIRKIQLAKLMEKRFLEQRKRIEQAEKKVSQKSQYNSDFLPLTYQLPNAATLSTTPPPKETLPEGVLLRQSVYPFHESKKLRTAEEARGRLRSGVLRPEAHPVFPHQTPGEETYQTGSLVPAKQEKDLLDVRLGPSGSLSFDPSIVVDFSLLNSPISRKSNNENGYPKRQSKSNPLDLLTIVSKASTKELYPDPSTSSPEDFASSEETKLLTKRAKLLEIPSMFFHNTSVSEPMALYVSKDLLRGDDRPRSENKRVGHRQAEEEIYRDGSLTQKVQVISEFGPYSQGNDPTAGIPPSEVRLPEMDISQLPLPESVRDSLRNYLEPLLATLKPLTKSVPGIPGLDYPILSVVPYTNFYCNSMPYPGFYADTEARCQTWHACDIDGRQATFLCPNGTVFNQAMMVCDWWYNSNCLDAPFYYTLNKRLFGHLLPAKIPPYNRITLELLDTIFL